MKAVFIDSANRTVEDFEYDGNLSSMYEKIGCRLVTLVRLPGDDDLFVDDEGLLSVTSTSPFFRIGDLALAGNGIVVGGNPETGESCDAKHDAAFYRERVRFSHADAVAKEKALRSFLDDQLPF